MARQTAARARAGLVRSITPPPKDEVGWVEGQSTAVLPMNQKRHAAIRRYQVPFDDPWDSLTPGAKKIVKAAADLLGEEGYDALTYERVAGRAGVNKSTIRYNFGEKAALVTAVVDAMIHDGCIQLALSLAEANLDQRVEGAVDAIGKMIVETQAFRGYFDVLPHALREPQLRQRILGLYHWWYAQNLQWLGLTGETSAEVERLRLGVSQVVAGLIDGLSIQVALNPDEADPGPALDALAMMLRSALAELTAAIPESNGL